MARYLAVAAVQREGRKALRSTTDDGAEATAEQPGIAPGERLIAVVNNGEWQSAIDVTHSIFYEKIYRRYREGIWKAMDLYYLDEKRADEMEDGRRVLMNGQPVPAPARK